MEAFEQLEQEGQLLFPALCHDCETTLWRCDGSISWMLRMNSLFRIDSEFLPYASPEDSHSRRRASSSSVLKDWEETKKPQHSRSGLEDLQISKPLAVPIQSSWGMVVITGNWKTANVERSTRERVEKQFNFNFQKYTSVEDISIYLWNTQEHWATLTFGLFCCLDQIISEPIWFILAGWMEEKQ